MALRIEVLATEAGQLKSLALDWSDRGALGVTEDAVEKARKEALPLTAVFCHPRVLTLRPHLLLWYRGLSMMSRKELAGDFRGPEDHGKGISPRRAGPLARVLNRHICAVLAMGPLNVETLKGIVYSSVGATLQGKWRNEVGRIQTVFEELVLSSLGALDQLKEVKTKNGWVEWTPEAVPDLRVLNARLSNGFFVEFGANPDIAVYDRESPDRRTIVCEIEVKGGTDESNAYYRLADAAGTLQRSRHANVTSASP